ncbi:MAG: hypothetical protein IJ273_03470 [Alphaproteobacteria bacterium]|nr:hypothetical protein [Alphaproteobacteria bacterium]MBQ8729192.1 hypothetical protein [Alphaproteobacteria bacterium]
MLNLTKTISIVGYDVSSDEKQLLFKTSFQCIKCKHVQNCASPKDCNFINYIRQRVPNTVYNCNLDDPVLNISIANSGGDVHALRTIVRAKRLRTFKPQLRCR